jgi:hypothetical protein
VRSKSGIYAHKPHKSRHGSRESRGDATKQALGVMTHLIAS